MRRIITLTRLAILGVDFGRAYIETLIGLQRVIVPAGSVFAPPGSALLPPLGKIDLSFQPLGLLDQILAAINLLLLWLFNGSRRVAFMITPNDKVALIQVPIESSLVLHPEGASAIALLTDWPSQITGLSGSSFMPRGWFSARTGLTRVAPFWASAHSTATRLSATPMVFVRKMVNLAGWVKWAAKWSMITAAGLAVCGLSVYAYHQYRLSAWRARSRRAWEVEFTVDGDEHCATIDNVVQDDIDDEDADPAFEERDLPVGHPSRFVRRWAFWAKANFDCRPESHTPAQEAVVREAIQRELRRQHVRHADVALHLDLMVVTAFTPLRSEVEARLAANAEAARRARLEYQLAAIPTWSTYFDWRYWLLWKRGAYPRGTK